MERYGWKIALGSVLLLVPVLLALVWGPYLDDSAYNTLHVARDLVAGRGWPQAIGVAPGAGEGLTWPVAHEELWQHIVSPADSLLSYGSLNEPARLRAPLYVLLLAGFFKADLPLTLLNVSWGLAALALYATLADALSAQERQLAEQTKVQPYMPGILAAGLLVCSPLVVATLGTALGWVAAWAWLAIAASLARRWHLQGVALVLLLGMHFDLLTIALAALLLLFRWRAGGRGALWCSLALLGAAGFWAWLVWQGWAAPYTLPAFRLAPLFEAVHALVEESEFYWLFLFLAAVGLVSLLEIDDKAALEPRALAEASLAPRRARSPKHVGCWGGALWCALALCWGGEVAGVLLATLGFLLAGLGIAWLMRWVERRPEVPRPKVPRCSRAWHMPSRQMPRRSRAHSRARSRAEMLRVRGLRLAVGLALLAGLPLALAEAASLWHRYQARPVVRQQLERAAGIWLREYSAPTAVVWGTERVGYLAERPTLGWKAAGSAPAHLWTLLRSLAVDPPAYCVTSRSLAWDRVVRTAWFKDSYEAVQTFASPYDTTSPLTIWGHRFAAQVQPSGASFGGLFRLLSVVPVTDTLAPGVAFDVRLYWEALQSPEDDYVVFVHFLDAHGELVASHDGPPGRRGPTRTWLPGMIVPDIHSLSLDPQLPAGIYRLQVGIYRWPDVERLPVWDAGGIEQPDRVLVLQTINVE